MSRYIFGIHPALEALKVERDRIEKIFLAEGPSRGPLAQVQELARREGLKPEFVSKQQLARFAEGGVHQGVVLRMAEFAYAEFDDVVERFKAAGNDGLVVLLDGIEDPHNLGAIIRSAWALGAQAVVIPKDRAAAVSGTVVKASAGAIAHLPVCRVTNLNRALEQLKEAGAWSAAADMGGDRPPWGVDFRSPTALVIGAEGAGVRRTVLEKCDFVVSIPMAGRLGSLNASVAGAVLLYEIARQRSSNGAVKKSLDT